MEQAASAVVMSDATAAAADAGRRGADGSAVAGRSAGVKLLVNYIDDGARVARWDATLSYLKYMFKHARRDGIFFQPEKSRFFVAERGQQTARRFVECVVAQSWWPLAGATREQFECQVKPLTRETRIDILGATVAVDEATRAGFLAEKAVKAMQRIDHARISVVRCPSSCFMPCSPSRSGCSAWGTCCGRWMSRGPRWRR